MTTDPEELVTYLIYYVNRMEPIPFQVKPGKDEETMFKILVQSMKEGTDAYIKSVYPRPVLIRCKCVEHIERVEPTIAPVPLPDPSDDYN